MEIVKRKKKLEKYILLMYAAATQWNINYGVKLNEGNESNQVEIETPQATTSMGESCSIL
jgi:hypothetical protein